MVGCVILAAGRSQRFGPQNKLLETVGAKPMVAGVLDAVCDITEIMPLAVTHDPKVTGLVRDRGIPTVDNPQPELGISGSIRIGLTALLERHDLSGCLFAVADQPYLTAESIRCMLERHAASKNSILALSFNGKRGNPVLFPKEVFPALLRLTGDVGGSAVIRQYPEKLVLVPAQSARELYDMDTVQSMLTQEE